MGALYLGERNRRVGRATNEEGGRGDLVEPVDEIAAQAVPEDFASLEQDKCFASSRLARHPVDFFNYFRGEKPRVIDETSQQRPADQAAAPAYEPVTQFIQIGEAHEEIPQFVRGDLV